MVDSDKKKINWKKWALKVADISTKHSQKIEELIKSNEENKAIFANLMSVLPRNLGTDVTEKDAIYFVAQHIILKPIFVKLYKGCDFLKFNPVARAIEKVLALLDPGYEEKDAEIAEYYKYVDEQISGIDNETDRQDVLKNLYNDFFNIAFKKMTDQLGITYTPVEVVDFIIHSVADVLKEEFGKDISDKDVTILDPFTGASGIFITRLLQSGLIDKKDLARKYDNEIFANEIVPLSYYIAKMNIAGVYHNLTGENRDFKGLCLGDTFGMYEGEYEKQQEDSQRSFI